MIKLRDFIKSVREWTKSKVSAQLYRTKQTYFTRGTAKLTFEKLASFILGNNRNSAQVLLNDFFGNYEETPVAKQTLFEARDKISYEAFADLSDMIVANFYSSGDAKTYKSYTLLGVDGSVHQVPQKALDTFGGQKQSAKGDDICAQARALVFNDLLNRIIVHATLNPLQTGERKIFLKMLDKLRCFKRLLLIFDRGFYSKELVEAMNKKSVCFLFRIKSNCQKAIDAANDPDQIVTVDNFKLRIINFVLPTGEVEKLATNVFDESLDVSDFAAIYEKRWGVETAYLMLKERLAIENFTSAKQNLMLQDFYAAVVTYNLMEIACLEQEEKHFALNACANRKHKQSANRNIVAHEIRKCLLFVMLETDLDKIDRKMDQIEHIIYRFFKDVRPERAKDYPRKNKFPSKKYPMNKKRNL